MFYKSTKYNNLNITNFSLSILSGILIFLSFPKFGHSCFGWIIFVPLLITIYNLYYNIKYSHFSIIKYSLITGIIGYSGIFYWLVPTFKVAGEQQIIGLLAMFLLSLYCSLYLIIFCFSLKLDFRITNILKSASLWVLLEIIRGNILSGFPWMLLGYSQYNFLSFIQIAEFGGVYVISFVLILTNIILANIIFFAMKDFKKYATKILFNFIFLIITFLMINFYGHKRIKELNLKISSYKNKLNIVLLQGNIDQYKKWDKKFYTEILDSYYNLVSSAQKQIVNYRLQTTTLFIWPESSVPGMLLEEEVLYNWFKELVLKTNSYHLVGTVFYGENKNFDEYYNGAILFSPQGKIFQKYAKIHLVPFGEYVPMRNFLSKYIKTINELGEFSEGKEYTVFNLDTRYKLQFTHNQTNNKANRLQITNINQETKQLNNSFANNQSINFSTLICYESIFPELTAKFVAKGASFLVNITNDAWYLKTSAPYQLFIFNIFRAIENRTFVLRAANTGISGIISPTGEVIKKTGIFTTEYLMYETKLYHESTFYTKNYHLQWLIYLGIYFICKIFISKVKL